jgi:non-specific serine/threonine protein kinase
MEEHLHTEPTRPFPAIGRGPPSSEAWPAHDLSVREAAAVLGITARSVRYAIARGDLAAAKRGGAYRLDGKELARFAARAGRSSVFPGAPQVVAFPHPAEAAPSLPAPLSEFVGRESELARLTTLLADPDVRIVTLTGPGGVGKTRLAIAAATALRQRFADGVAFVSLATIFRPELVVPAIAEAMALRALAGRDRGDQLRAFLCDKRLLLVLDNLEQVLEAAPELARLVAAAPGLTLLATSRAPLRLGGEREVPVPPLRVAGEDATPAELLTSEAGRLFIARAQGHDPSFRVEAESAPHVAAICARLDGLPLAIELAAARVKVLPPRHLRQRLERRLPLLAPGVRDAPARHRTMRDAIAWSYGLLTPAEQRLFRRLGVFAGGFTLEAAEWVTGSQGVRASGETITQSPRHPETLSPPSDTLDLIAALVDKSLVRPVATAEAEATTRFGMLETIREFALEQLAASGEVEATQAAHATHCIALVDMLLPTKGAAPAGWLERLAPELPNLRGALSHLVERSEADAALRLAEVWQLLAWSSRADSGEALLWLEAALTLGGNAAARVHALIAAAGLAALRGDHSRAIALAEDGLHISRDHNYPFGVAYAHFYRGVAEEWSGDLAGAAARYAEAIAGWQVLDEPYWLALAQTNLGMVTFWRGDASAAAALMADGLAGSRAAGDAWGTALALGALAAVACARGDLPRAVALYAESLDLWSAMEDHRGIAGTLAGLAGVAVAGGEYLPAARLLGAAAALAEAVQTAHLVHHEQHQRVLAATRARLDADTFAQEWATGRALSPEEIAGLAAAPVRTAAAQAANPDALTRREHEVYRLIVAGKATREIAAALYMSPRTAEWHVRNILDKLGVSSRREAIAQAEAQGPG